MWGVQRGTHDRCAFSFSDPYTWNDLQRTVMPIGQFKTQSSQHVTFF